MRRGGNWPVFCLVGFLFFVLAHPLFPLTAMGEPARGVYGVPSMGTVHPSSYVQRMEEAGVTVVFVPPEKETVAWFKGRGFRVCVSVNAFGGKDGWQRYPDARPVKADGSLLGSEKGYKDSGGICPSHIPWRQERLAVIEKILRELGGKDGIDGIWLDFIRYPGQWEEIEPRVPDTCYCPRCLDRFQAMSGIQLPTGLKAADAASWIRRYCPYEWMRWKKKEIESFVTEVRDLLDRYPGSHRPLLGLFLVPWTKGERENALSYLLAQDSFELSRVVDVISPMLYHRMCGRPPQWVRDMTEYYRETARCQVWPILQAVDCGSAEFGEVVRFAAQGGAAGILVYSFAGMGHEHWERLGETGPIPNLIRTEENGASSSEGALPRFQGPGERRGESGRAAGNGGVVSLTASDEWGEEWRAPLRGCEPGAEYVFTAKLWRDKWENGVYPSVGLWGREYLVDTHLKAREWQPVRVNVICPDRVTDPYFRFINRNRNATFRLKDPSVREGHRSHLGRTPGESARFFDKDFFPIGVYGATLENLVEIKRLALNTVILGGSGEGLKNQIEKCHEVGLRYILSVPHDPDRLPPFLDEIAPYVRPHDMAFYVNDEPEIWSFPVNQAEDIYRLVKGRFPEAATCMAVVRPQGCRDYEGAADFLMMDQYPVPSMPMTWLSDSMDRCAKEIDRRARQGAREKEIVVEGLGRDHGTARGMRRLAAVVQAFGGDPWADLGWPRLPTWEEMDCLAFLSVVHGARGIFFFTYSEIGREERGRERLGRVVGRLNQLYPWLVVDNEPAEIPVEMISTSRFDSQGRPAVQCCLKEKGSQALLIAVNTIGTGVEAVIQAMHTGETPKGDEGARSDSGSGAAGRARGGPGKTREVFSGEEYPLREGKLRVRLGPFGVKAFVFEKPKADVADQ